MSRFKMCYPGVYTDSEKEILAAYKAEKDALNCRGDIDIGDLINGRLPKETLGVGRVDKVSETKLKSNYLQSDPTNPLYFDQEYAKNSTYGDIIAFPVLPAHDGAFFDAMPYQLRDTITISGLTHDFDILLPVYEGDSLYYVIDEQTFTDITPAEGSEFRTFDITGSGRVYNQKGELVCKGCSRVKESLRTLQEGSTTPRMIEQDCPDWWAGAPVTYTSDSDWDVIKKYWSEETRRGSEPLYWDDVNVGDMPTPVLDGPFKAIRIGGPGGPPPEDADGPAPDGSDVQGEDHPAPVPDEPKDLRTIRLQMEDPETFMKMVRSDYDGKWYMPEELPSPDKKRSIIMNFHARDAAVRMMTNWCGDHGWIKNIKWRIMRKTPGYDTPEYPDNPPSFICDVPYSADPRIANWYEHQQHGLENDLLLCRGYITQKFVENGEHLVEMQWWVSPLFGKVYEEGVATIKLPSK